MNDVIKEVLENENVLYYIADLINEKNNLKTSLDESQEVVIDLQQRIEKAVEYGNNCLEMLKDQDNYMCESIDIVELLRMIHKNYIDILNGRSDE